MNRSRTTDPRAEDSAPPESAAGEDRSRSARHEPQRSARRGVLPRAFRTGRRWSAVRVLVRRVPRAAWLCALVAVVGAAAWSIVTPPFQVPDEPEHVAYVKQLAETGRRPSTSGNFSIEESAALADLELQHVAQRPQYTAISTRAQQRRLELDLRRNEALPRTGSEFAGVAASQPPLYYALQAIPYTLGSDTTLLGRIELMRLFSALLAGVSVLFTFLFLRETLPGEPWAWTIGALGVALAPLFGFMSGAVNPESLVCAVSAATFFGLARGFRRNLSRSHAVLLGVLVAIGTATKLNFLGLVPGILLGMVVLSVRSARVLGRAAYVSMLIALTVALSPVLLFMLIHIASGKPVLVILTGALSSLHGSVWSEISYIWQFYLPRIPGMRADFGGVFTAWQLWFKGYVGQLGWLDTTFPGWVYDFALIPTALIAGFAIRTILAAGARLRGRISEAVVYLVMGVGLLVLIAGSSYQVFSRAGAEYAQARYLLPLIPLLGVALALAARGAGRRWGPAFGAGLVMLFLTHDIFSQLQVVARYYG